MKRVARFALRVPVFLLPLSLFAGSAHAAPVVQMALGSAHTCALFGDGAVKCFGANDAGQLGLGDTSDRGGAPGQMGESLGSVDLGAAVSQIAAGSRHSCALLRGGAAKCWGINDFGQLGLGDVLTRGAAPGQMGASLPHVDFGAGRSAVKLSLGDRHSCAVLDDGSVKCWGNNTYGQLGQTDLNHRGTAAGQMGDALLPVALGQPALDVAAGGRHTCALLADHTVKCFGDGSLGQLGDGGTAGQAVALGAGRTARQVFAGFVHSCALLDDMSLKCWGFNGDGRLGLGDTVNRGATPESTGDALAALKLAPGQDVQQMQCGLRHCCAVFDANTLKCFGVNLRGTLGLEDALNRGTTPAQMGDDLPFVALGRLVSAKKVFTGEYHSCVLLAGARVKCFGDNRRGQLGLGDLIERGLNAGTMGDQLPVLGL